MNKLRWLGGLILASVALFGGLAATAVAAEAPALERIVKDGVLRVGLSGDQAPLNMRDRSGALTGYEVDLAELLAAAFGVDLRMIVKPFPELLPALKAGEVDMVISGMSITPERTLEVSFVGPYVMSGKSLLTKSPLLARAQDPSDIDEEVFKLVVLGNSTSETFVKKYMPKSEIVTAQSYSEAVAMVREDKVDAMVADMPACILAVLRHPDAGLLTLLQPMSIEPIGIALPIDDLQLKNLVEGYLNAIESMGLLEALRNKWFEDSAWVASLP